jgi:tyrosyl-tRNA synthetase
VLAQEVTRLVHGDGAVREAEAAAEKLFRRDLRSMSEPELLQVFSNVPSSQTLYVDGGWAITDFLAEHRVASSKSEATRLIRGGGIYVNDRRVTDEKERLRPDEALQGAYFVVRKGKKDNFLIRIRRGVSGG